MNIFTLGPEGTNCEKAAFYWCLEKQIYNNNVFLYPTLEVALDNLLANGNGVLLGCIVYPKLHSLVFDNLNTIYLDETFTMQLHDMVISKRRGLEIDQIRTISSHPAPVSLKNKTFSNTGIVKANSNSEAALQCAMGETDACVTTGYSSNMHGLEVVERYSGIQMGFTIHKLIK